MCKHCRSLTGQREKSASLDLQQDTKPANSNSHRSIICSQFFFKRLTLNDRRTQLEIRNVVLELSYLINNLCQPRGIITKNVENIVNLINAMHLC